MRSTRFVNNSRKLFGTHVLQMNNNTILRLCKNNKFHFSLKQHQMKVETFNSIISQITQKIQISDVDTLKNLEETKNEEISVKSIYEDLLKNNSLFSEVSSINAIWEMSKVQCLSTPCHHDKGRG